MAGGTVSGALRGAWRGALLAAFAALAALYAFVLPPFEAPDEASHFFVAATIARDRVLPEPAPGTGAQAQRLHEAFQPPLYYLAIATILAPFDLSQAEAYTNRQNPDWYEVPGVANLYFHNDDDDPRFVGVLAALRAARLFSIVLGGLAVAGAMATARALAPESAGLPLVAGALLAFAPKFLNMSASVSNDIALTAAAIWAVAVMASGSPNPRRAAAAGALIAVAAMCKVGGIALLVPAAVWLLSAPIARARNGSILIVVFLAVAGPWLARNQMLYGDPLGWARAEAANLVTLRSAPLGAAEILATVPVWLRSLWGDLAIGQALPGWMDAFFWLVLAGGLTGLVAVFARRPISPTRAQVILAAWIIALLAGYVTWMRTRTATENGRLLMPAAGAFAAFVALGWRALLADRPRVARAGGAIIAVAMIACGALAPALVIGPAFALPEPLSEAQVLSDFGLAPSNVVFAGQVRLLHVEVGVKSVTPGGRLPVAVYWGAVQPIQRSLRAIVEVVDDTGRPVGRVEAIPNQNRTSTQRWVPGAIFRDEYAVPIDSGAGRMAAEVRVGLRDVYASPESLSLDGTGQNRFAAGRVRIDGPGPSAAPAPGETPVDARFGGALALRGAAVQTGTTISLHLRHEALAAPRQDYVFFVHALNGAGELVGQSDGEPVGGAFPTSVWARGDIVPETRTLATTEPAARIVAGWYERGSGARLPAKRADGTPWADNVAILWEARP